MKEFKEAWALLRIAARTVGPTYPLDIRKRLVRSHWRIVVGAWHEIRFERPRPTLPELLVASGAVS